MFDRHKGTFFPKENGIGTYQKTVYMGVKFSFKKWYIS